MSYRLSDLVSPCHRSTTARSQMFRKNPGTHSNCILLKGVKAAYSGMNAIGWRTRQAKHSLNFAVCQKTPSERVKTLRRP